MGSRWFTAIAVAAVVVAGVSGLLWRGSLDKPSARLSELKSPANKQSEFPTMSKEKTRQPAKKRLPALDEILSINSLFEQHARIYQLAGELSEPELITLIDHSLVLPRYPDRLRLTRILFSRFILIDPARALAHFFHRVKPGERLYPMLGHLYRQWMLVDPSGASLSIQTLPSTYLKEQVLESILKESRLQGGSEVELLASAISPRAMFLVEKTRAYAMVPADAFEHLLALDTSFASQRNTMHELVRVWTIQDPQAALARIQLMDEGKMKRSMYQAYFSQWAPQAPEPSLEMAIELDDDSGHIRSNVMVSIAGHDPHLAMMLADKYREQLLPSAKASIMDRWAINDPRAAAAYIEQSPRPFHQSVIDTVANRYTQQYTDEGREWAQQMGRHTYLMSSQLISKDFDKAQALFLKQPPGWQRRHMLSELTRYKGWQDLQAAQQWLAVFEDEPGYKSAQHTLLEVLISKDPSRGAEALLTLDELHMQLNMTYSLVNSWFKKDPAAIESWVLNLPDGKLRDKALKQLAESWKRTNTDKAKALIDQVGNPELRQKLESE